MAPINVVIVVITMIESLRAFDLAFIINQRHERPRAAVDADHEQQHQRGEPVGFGSAIAVVLLVISLGADRRLPDPDDARGQHDERRDVGASQAAAPAAAAPRGSRAAPGRAARLPRFDGRLIWLLPLLWAVYISLRPFGDTAGERLRLAARPALSFDELHRTPGPRANLALLLPEHADRDHPGGDRRRCSSRRWWRSP